MVGVLHPWLIGCLFDGKTLVPCQIRVLGAGKTPSGRLRRNEDVVNCRGNNLLDAEPTGLTMSR